MKRTLQRNNRKKSKTSGFFSRKDSGVLKSRNILLEKMKKFRK